MGTAAAAVARLERALAHGKAPTIGLVTGSVGDWTSRPRTLRASDLLTVRGPAKPVKPNAPKDPTIPSTSCPADTPNGG